jgi:hypothetical protein
MTLPHDVVSSVRERMTVAHDVVSSVREGMTVVRDVLSLGEARVYDGHASAFERARASSAVTERGFAWPQRSRILA